MPVELQRRNGRMDVVLDGEVLATVDAGAPAQQLAQWVRYQLGSGRDATAIRRLMRGTPIEASPAVPDVSADLSILRGSIKALSAALATGQHDRHLDALEAAERSGKDRKGAVEAIDARRQA